jgi:hypothetical protein
MDARLITIIIVLVIAIALVLFAGWLFVRRGE